MLKGELEKRGKLYNKEEEDETVALAISNNYLYVDFYNITIYTQVNTSIGLMGMFLLRFQCSKIPRALSNAQSL